MRKQNLLSIVFLTMATMLVVQINALAQAQVQAQAQAAAAAKPIKKDEVSFSIARRLNALNESPVSAIVTELDTVIEITSITMRPDGKAEVMVKEQAPSSAAFTNKSARLLFLPPASGDKDEKWTWDQFEENRRFYPVDRLFPYAQNELGKRKQATVAGWNAFLGGINKQGEAASKALETAKAILKADPPPMASVTNIRKALTEAMKENRTDDILNVYRELNQQTEAITTLGDTFSDLKTNDAYLRLIDEFKNSVNVTNATRKSYVQTVATYNELILRLPFGLVAYGLQFHKIEANISEE